MTAPGGSARAGASVDIVGVTKRYGAAPAAVDELHLAIEAGEFLTLLGPSGSGKTTTLNMIAGFVDVTAGEIRMDGARISELPPHRRNIGMVFQQYALFPHMTVAENIGYPLRQRKVAKKDIARSVAASLERVQLTAFADRLPRELSGGQQQRVAVARATVFEPRLLLMDEPLGALDKKLREALQLGFKQLHRELGVTMIYVTHDQEEALVMSDRIAVFNDGHIEQIGTATDLYERPTSRFVASFLGESNMLDGSARHAGASTVVTSSIQLSGGRSDVADGSAATLVVRPERTRIAQSADPPGPNRVRGRVREVVYLGSTRKLVVDLDDDLTWTVAVTAAAAAGVPGLGETVELTFDECDAYVVPPHSHLGAAVPS